MTSLEEAIRDSATGKIKSYERHLKQIFDENQRRHRRSVGSPDVLPSSQPALWNLGDEFNPYHVRGRAKSISHSIERSLSMGSYEPHRPGGFTISKRHGGNRTVTVFPIADEVVSRRLYRSILRKNRARLSPRSYAYRDDLGVHDALTYLHSEWRAEQRIFVAQFDFRDYFGSLSHRYLWRTLDGLDLAMTRRETQLVRAFLTSPRPFLNAEQRDAAAPPSSRGIHQGTSISLLLANIAATPLDREFERLGVSFVRYADDVVIWSRDYSSICQAVEELYRFAAASGCDINQEKSPGVQLLVNDQTKESEIRQTERIEYLSHSVGLRSVGMSKHALEQLKVRVSKHLFDNLLREPLLGTLDPSRIARGRDRDYTVCIWQLRRELYGNLSEEQLRRLLRSPLPAGLSLVGSVSQFPLLNDIAQLKDLDSWIATQTWLAVRRRAELLKSSIGKRPDLWNLSRDELIDAKATSSRSGAPIDTRLPSVVRMAQLVQRAVKTHGIQCLGPGPSLYD